MSDKTEQVLFLLEQPETFTWPVTVLIPLDGRYGKVTFDAKFPNLSDEDRDALVASDESGAPKFTNRQVADKLLLGFSKLAMPDGSMLPFTPENLERVLSKPRVANAVIGTFMAVSRGMAAEKNA